MLEEEEIKELLKAMENDPSMVTKSAYRANAEVWPDNRISFVDAHLTYLKQHPAISPENYLSNLKLMIRKR